MIVGCWISVSLYTAFGPWFLERKALISGKALENERQREREKKIGRTTRARTTMKLVSPKTARSFLLFQLLLRHVSFRFLFFARKRDGTVNAIIQTGPIWFSIRKKQMHPEETGQTIFVQIFGAFEVRFLIQVI